MQRGRARPPRGNRHQNPQHHHHPSPPPHSAILPGTPVSIVLKQDQPTGRQVTGIVSDVLTRGDHPRGVKVRLRDGRVGRVQGVVEREEGERGEEGAGAGFGLELGRGVGRGRGGIVGGRLQRDVRDDDEYLYDEGRRGMAGGSGGLFGALEEADRRYEESRRCVGDGLGRAEEDGGGGGGEVVHCPVCREFEGDEAAVAYHVEGHFGS